MKTGILSIIMLFVFTISYGQSNAFKFKHLDITNGLSNNQVKTIYKDSRGFVWIGTVDGLNRFDGYSVKIYRNVDEDSTSIPDNTVNFISEDYSGKLWIETNVGLTIYDPTTDKFSNDHPLFHKNITLPVNKYLDLFTDNKNNFWLVHERNGLYKYDIKNDSILYFRSSEEIGSSVIEGISVDKKGNFWIINSDKSIEIFSPTKNKVINRYKNILNTLPDATYNYNLFVDDDMKAWLFLNNQEKGVFCFDSKTLNITKYNSSCTEHHISHNDIDNITADRKGNIIISTDHGGINVIDKETGKISIYQNEAGDKNSLSQNSITTTLCDNNSILWVGTYKKGVNYYHPDLFKFTTYALNLSRDNWLNNQDINTFAEDNNGNLWLGSNGGGLIYFDRKNNTFKTYKHDPNNPNSISSNVIVDLLIDHSGGLWIGTYIGGLNYYNGKTFKHYKNDPKNLRSIPSNNIWSICEDCDSNLWVGTLGDGITLLNREDETFSRFSPYSTSTRSNRIMAISENVNNNIWFATANGIVKYDKQNGRFVQFLKDDKTDNTLSNNYTLDIYCDSRGLVWIATRNGLDMYNPLNNKFTHLGEKFESLSNNVITILEDDASNLWISSPSGLTNLIVSNNENGDFEYTTKLYDETDGLHGKEFNEHAALKIHNGDLVFGGADGFSIFNPEDMYPTVFTPKILFTTLKLDNKEIKAGQKINNRILLDKSLSNTNKITLNYYEKTFSIGFTALNFLNPSNTIFHYKLDNFNDDWTTTGINNREVVYTNLHPGDYKLRIYSSDLEDNLKSEEISLEITILPPFWHTKWAYSLYLIVFILLFFLVLQVLVKKERNKFELHQERTETAKVHEMDLMKLKFFTNISHEFRTPLTLILSPLDKLISREENKSVKEQLKLIQRNGKRLLNMVNQLLDFRRLEVQGLTLDVHNGEFISFCKDTIESFSDLSESRNISLHFSSNVNELQAAFDYDKIEKIIFNLLSNAFKFTPENGEISVSLLFEDTGTDKNYVHVVVEDNGIGIPKEKQEVIFDRFVQNISQGVVVNKGSGIGLSLTREFVQMHNGRITLESTPEKGSKFTIILPIIGQAEQQGYIDEIIVNKIHKKVKDISEEQDNNKKKTCNLLLVEDNLDIRFYLKDNLKEEYQIAEANNGVEAWEAILENMPDLIVSDIMMPEMDGIELCKKIKTDKRTSHIPVILLTALISDQQKYEGLETGADAYITKPFNFEMLELRIEKLIEQRRQLRKSYNKNFEIQPSEITITSLDEKFLQKVKNLTENNMQEPDFSVEKLSLEIGISRAHLYNKLLALTGKTPIEYIRIMRIRRAAQLLEKSQLTVMEVAYKVGFNDPRYFTKHFKNEYKMTPSQYIKQYGNKSEKTTI